jgi:hypothetical protein
MSSQVIYLPNSGAPPRSVVRQRLADVIAIFERIDAQELLAALPECAIARQNHLTALNLFLDAETELRDLWAELGD